MAVRAVNEDETMKKEKTMKEITSKKKHKGYQEFIDEIDSKLREKKEIEELLKRVIILKADDVMKEMEIKEKNNKIMKLLHEPKNI